ncbi:uncharacterized protein LOC120251437 [Dioscorea cayenensis subsp. rotundata]|uniref:Uncharacterized protein LOC120251437 n=1 Tax=Dioscorea cayennensis subsp. rotundata TaxID=55577 RepID=A0AB40ANS4_DIOCR|nr:uncharacterized protein LOC120251437 [Dioscorea cayenensis subsp. rotundata]
MSIFKLPAWVIKDIDKIRRDFLWKGPNLGSKEVRLIAWSKITRLRDMGGWGILNLQTFNNALLGKWWWKLTCNPNSNWAKIINANYSISDTVGVLSHTPPRNKSFFWAGVTSTLSPFRSCITKSIRNGSSTSLWSDRWHDGLRLKDCWPDLFNDCTAPWITIRQFTQYLNNPELLFPTSTPNMLSALLENIPDCSQTQDDVHTWTLDKSGTITIKSFYKFLIDGGTRSSLYLLSWKNHCPSKITLFCWLAGEDKILTLSNLFKKGYNFQNSTDTCVLCHNASENLQHLFIDCEFSKRIWALFSQILEANSLPQTIPSLWTIWIPSLAP